MCGISAPSELLFSKAGEVVAARRSSIKPKNVDMILFFNKSHCVLALCSDLLKFLFVWGRVGGGGQYGIISVYHVNTQYQYSVSILTIVSNCLCLVSPTSTTKQAKTIGSTER